MVTKRLIVTGDDFGRSPQINAAILRAHREGILTSASLMVTGEAFAEAVAIAKATPSLAVGLHLVLVGGRAALPREEIPHLVDADGFFPADPFRAGIKYFFSPACRRELAREIEAQFARFAATGLPLSHVDGHCHFHLHPVVFNLLLPVAARYKAKGIRIPHDDFRAAIAYDHRFFLRKAAWAFAFSFLRRMARRHLKPYPLVAADRVYGLFQTGRMHEDYLLFLLPRLYGRVIEWYFHPSTTLVETFGPNPGDLAALLNPAVRRALEKEGIVLTNYSALL